LSYTSVAHARHSLFNLSTIAANCGSFAIRASTRLHELITVEWLRWKQIAVLGKDHPIVSRTRYTATCRAHETCSLRDGEVNSLTVTWKVDATMRFTSSAVGAKVGIAGAHILP